MWVKKDIYPLSHMRDIIDRIAGTAVPLIAAVAYWSLAEREKMKEKTAFSVLQGKFKFNIIPYGTFISQDYLQNTH